MPVLEFDLVQPAGHAAAAASVQAGVVDVPEHTPLSSVHPAAQLPVVVEAQSSITALHAGPGEVTAAHAVASAVTEVEAASRQA